MKKQKPMMKMAKPMKAAAGKMKNARPNKGPDTPSAKGPMSTKAFEDKFGDEPM